MGRMNFSPTLRRVLPHLQGGMSVQRSYLDKVGFVDAPKKAPSSIDLRHPYAAQY
jgi:hypothetical protein